MGQTGELNTEEDNIMKELYEKPKIIIELFYGQDIVTFSGDINPEDPDPGDDPIITSSGLNDA